MGHPKSFCRFYRPSYRLVSEPCTLLFRAIVFLRVRGTLTHLNAALEAMLCSLGGRDSTRLHGAHMRLRWKLRLTHPVTGSGLRLLILVWLSHSTDLTLASCTDPKAEAAACSPWEGCSTDPLIALVETLLFFSMNRQSVCP